jgi:hypothetical protein
VLVIDHTLAMWPRQLWHIAPSAASLATDRNYQIVLQ